MASPPPPQLPAIPMDILWDVLSRLPAKSLVRFRLVSKLWYSSQCDPFFIQSHSSRSKSRLGHSRLTYHCVTNLSFSQWCIFSELRSENKSDVAAVTSVLTSKRFPFSHPIDSLICFINISCVSVINLSTREVFRLPDSSIAFPGEESERRRYYPCYLFGSDSGGLYKVLNVCTIVTMDRIQRLRSRTTCEIFTIGTNSNSWKKIKPRPFKNFPSKTSYRYDHHVESVCVNGVIYWSQYTEKGKGKENGIGGFEVKGERFLPLIAFPKGHKAVRPFVAECRGRVSMLECLPCFSAEVNIWVLEDVASNVWKKMTIDRFEIRNWATCDCDDLVEFRRGSAFVSSDYSTNIRRCIWHRRGHGDHSLIKSFAGIPENIYPLKRFASVF